MITRLPSLSAHESASKIQSAFRNHQARLKLKNQAAWQLHEKLEYSSEQTQAKLKDMFEKLLNASDSLSPSVAKLLKKARLSVEERELLRSTNPDSIVIEAGYHGPHIEGPISRQTFLDLIEAFQHGHVLHVKYVCHILHQARAILQTLPNYNRIDLFTLHHVYIIGDLHGQLADLLHIFNANGIPAIDNPYIFNGDFIDRGENSVEVILLLMVALILYPCSVFLNRGNHEDMMVASQYGFEDEINRKYCKYKTPLLDLFKDIFSWLPLYSSVHAEKSKFIIIHGGISNRINLEKIKSLQRNRYITMEIPPESKSGDKRLTADEDDEFSQIQDLLWSDPDPYSRRGCRNNDERNIGSFFGPNITEQFLNKYHYSMIIRSHQVKQKGYEYTHDEKVLTVFSASNYCDGYNWGAIIRWDYKEKEPWLISYKIERVDMKKLSFDKQITLFEDPAYQSLLEKIVTNKSLLQKEFEKRDRYRTNHLPWKVWSEIMTNILRIDLPWLTLRSKLVQEDKEGILYNTMFDEYARDNTKFQFNSGIMEDLYIRKDLLIRLFNFIDQDHSGFISLNEFSDVLKLLLYDNNDKDGINEANIEELSSAMDLDKNGRIDINEFLESFRIANVKNSGKSNDRTQESRSSKTKNTNTNF